MRKQLVVGNWKMNAIKDEAIALITHICNSYNSLALNDNKNVIIAPPFPYVHYVSNQFANYSYCFAAAQNCSSYEKGAYTGDVSAAILASLDVQFVIIGHSERRQFFNEDTSCLLAKLQQAISHQIQPVFCCGESEAVRTQEQHFNFVQQQLQECIFKLNETDFRHCVIAYEPIWAIGTGQTATPEQAQEMHLFIRDCIAKNYNETVAAATTILYGGSVNAKNAKTLFSQPDIDGGLVGGASLIASDFIEIIKAM